MEKLIPRPLNGLVAVGSIEMLVLDIFFLSDEDYGNLFNAVRICNSVIFVEVRGIVQIVENVLDRGCFKC